jgi:molybdopterin-binding protein
MKHGARNDLPAEVTAIKRGAVMCQVEVKLVGTDYNMSSVMMTLDSLDSLGLKVGDKVQVVAKAVNVLLMKG